MSRSDDDELVDPLDSLLSEEIPAMPPITANGSFVPAPIQPMPIPEASEENMACLRGPCRHYVEIVTRFNAGNTKGSLGYEPEQINRFCRVIPGSDVDLTDETVFSCNEWNPIDPTFVAEREVSRKRYLESKESV